MARLAPVLALACAISASARVVYVAPGGTGDGSSWAQAFGSVRDGIGDASAGDTVVLDDGTYHEHGITLPSLAFTLGSRYVLDGDTAHVRACVIDGDSTSDDTASVLVLTGANDTSTHITGLTLTRGNGSLLDNGWATYYPRMGGAVACTSATAGMTFDHVRFLRNAADAAGAVFNGSCRYVSCVFDSNYAKITGGALAGMGQNIIENCTFSGNGTGTDGVEGSGGAVISATNTYTDCVFRSNWAGMVGGAIGDNTGHTFVRCRFDGNRAQRGGAVYGGAQFSASDCVFEGNTAAVAGGAFCDVGDYFSLVERCTFTRNRAPHGGVAHGGAGRMVRCLMVHNQGGIGTSDVELIYCTMQGNDTTIAGTPYYGIVDSNEAAGDVEAYNCIIDDTWRYTGTVGSVVCLHTLVKRFVGATPHMLGWIVGEDPKFMDPALMDYRLRVTSPCINAGHPDTALGAEPSCSQSAVDMGFYGRTDSAGCAAQLSIVLSDGSFTRSLYRYEIAFDTVQLTHDGPDSFYIRGKDDAIVDGVSGTGARPVVLEIVPCSTWVGPGDTVTVVMRNTTDRDPTGTGTYQIRFGFPASDFASMAYNSTVHASLTTDSILGGEWNCGLWPVGDTLRRTFTLRNRGANTITVDSLRLSTGTAFSLDPLQEPFHLTPGDSLAVSVTFVAPAAEVYQARIRLSSPNYLYADSSIMLRGSGGQKQRPYVSIDSISPNPVTWGQPFSISATANDSDALGPQPAIVVHRWAIGSRLALASADPVSVPSESLSIGWNRITYTAQDNEGDWADTAVDSIQMVGRAPVVDSLYTDRGLVLRTQANVTLTVVARDQDEFAAPSVNNGDIVEVVWHSFQDGPLDTTTGFVLTMPANRLSLGVHRVWVRVTDDEGDTAVSDTLVLPVQTDIGRVLLVAGTAFTDYFYFFQNIAPNCNYAYKKLRERGFSDEQIYYMNPVGWQSIDDPYTNSNIVDTTVMSLEVMREYLLSAAVRQDVANDVPLVIHLLGHGTSTQENGRFYLGPTEYLTPDTLAAWLDSYGDLTSGNSQIILLLDFCYSGAFQTRLRTLFQQNRFVITSSDAANTAYFSRGRSFTWTVWYDVHKGEDLATAFTHAQQWSVDNAPGANQANPLLNADLNSQYNTPADLALAQEVYIGGSQQLQDLTGSIDSVWFDGGSGTVYARSHGTLATGWARVFTPDFDYASQSVSELPVVSLGQVDDSTWSGAYLGGWVIGDYLFKVDGTDMNGDLVMGGAVQHTSTVIGVGIARTVPVEFGLRVAPNAAGVALVYGLPVGGVVSLCIYDVGGRLVRQVADGYRPAGFHAAMWDGRDERGRRTSAGFVVVRLAAHGRVLNRRLALAR